ncbi:hypothetical protein GPECTOR_9g418 [Gonium pectorale]|uniref:Uncharacterized protein n=1 Tax=Gonium pectorale TaxID=33097 RepID=A0A150GRF6_GONPE|nr:hypothetical protein GPECTOR_9g418 [Gonium pectorale]|eukprot:KXZ52374.1 hypothetical protein GPECTOR_9g418 [Gonium pectorale]
MGDAGELAVLAGRCLKYGDVVYFKVDGKQGFISAHDRATPQIRTEELSDAAESPPDMKDCLFEVTKKYQYTQKKALIAELARNGLVPEEVLGEVQKGVDAMSSFEERLAGHVAKSKDRHRLMGLFGSYLRENAVNEEEFKQVVGESVLYGQVLQLRHVATGKFATIKRTAADVERGALKLVLEEGGQEGSWLQVFSGYRTKPEGAKLMPGEVVALKGVVFSGNGLHASAGDIVDPAMLPVDRHPYVTSSKEVCASPDVTSFKIIPFCVHEKLLPAIRERLCGMNSVSIQDLVANTVYINVLGALNDKYLYFESPLTRSDPSRIGGPDAWRLELVADGGAWLGMPLTNGCKLRIRHLPTGTYLAALSSKAREAGKALKNRRIGSSHALAAAAAAAEADGATPATPSAAAAEAPAAAAPVVGGLPPALHNAVERDEDVLHEEAFRLVLTRRYNVPDTLWELHTFTKDEPVGTKVYAFLKHVATQYWLSGAGPPIPQPPSSDPDDPQEEQVFPVVHPEKLERNVLLVVKLSDSFTVMLHDLQRVMVLLRELRNSLNKEKTPPEKELIELVEGGREDVVLEALANTQYPDKFRLRYPALKRSLQDLVRWLDRDTWTEATDANSPHREYQTLLRELGMIDLLVTYMGAARVHLFSVSPKLRATRLGQWVLDSGRKCHKVLQLCCKANEANQAYVARHAALVMSHLSLPLTAPDTLASIYEDNMSQMQASHTAVSPNIVEASVALIRHHGHKPRFVNFLRQICGTRGRPMPSNQNWIIAEIVGDGRNPLDVFCRAGPASRPDSEGASRETWVIRCPRKDDPSLELEVDASNFCGDTEDLTKEAIREWDPPEENSNPDRELFIYYCYCLKFIVSLCYGRNSLVRDAVLAASERYGLGLEFDALLSAISNQRLPYIMRGYCVLRALYVDIEPYQPLKLPRHIRMLSRGFATGSTPAGSANSDTINALIKMMLVQLKEVLNATAGADEQHSAPGKEDEEINPEERGLRTVGRNTLVLNMLKMVAEMFRLGMMDLESVRTQEMLTVLLEIIQKLDSLPLDMPERFERGYASKVVMELKKVALGTIDFALDMKSEQQCAAVFERFAKWQASPERREYWARKSKSSSRGMHALVQAAGGFLAKNRVRSGASLAPSSGNKVVPSPAAPSLATGNEGSADPEAPQPKDGAPDTSGEDMDYGGLPIWVSEAFAFLASDNEDGDFPLFKLDTVDDTQPLHHQTSSPIMKLMDLVRYDDEELTARTFTLLERLTSKREKLLGELLRTFVVTDDDLISLAAWAVKQVEHAEHAYNYLGSLDAAVSAEACRKATAAINALTSMLQPHTSILLADPRAAPESGTEAPEKILLSKTTAANCQYLLYDMQVHHMVLKFLKLPLKRRVNADPRKLQTAEDPTRHEVFRACLRFLRNFMVVGDLDVAGANVPSPTNQAAVLPSLELLLSFLDTKGLPASDTVIALFINNQTAAASEGEKVIRKLIKLISRYGDKQHAGWLELLGKVVVVNGTPIKRNQMVAMQLISQFDDEVLALLPGDAGLEELRTLLSVERLSAQASGEPPVSTLAYHTACAQLLAECCLGKEPELVVKASGYMSLPQLLDVLLLQAGPDASEANLRYVQRAYWRLLQNAFFATDTDNTKVQVRAGANRIWPTSGDGEGEGVGSGADLLMARFLDMPAGGDRRRKHSVAATTGGGCLMQNVLEEVKRALAEPQDALANADSATFFLTTAVFPALTDYFHNHWQSHVSKLPLNPSTLLANLFEALWDLHHSLKRLREVANSGSMRSELKMALANTRALLRAMPIDANVTGRSLAAQTVAGGGRPSAPSASQTTAITATSQRVVQKEWGLFLRRLAVAISVELNPVTHAVVEVLHSNALFAAAASSLGMGDSPPVFEQASLLRLARLLAGPYGRIMPGSCPPMCCEQLAAALCELLASAGGRDPRAAGGGGGEEGGGGSSLRPELLVKLVRSVCAAAVLDDGAGGSDGRKLRDAWASLGLLRVDGNRVEDYEEPSPELLSWRQSKFDKLGATRAAVSLLAHPRAEVQLEALQLLRALLQGGNRSVQSTLYDILKDGSRLADSVFENIHSAFERCRKYVARRTYSRPRPTQNKKKDSAVGDAKMVVAGAVTALVSGGKNVAGALGTTAGAVAGKLGRGAGRLSEKVVRRPRGSSVTIAPQAVAPAPAKSPSGYSQSLEAVPEHKAVGDTRASIGAASGSGGADGKEGAGPRPVAEANEVAPSESEMGGDGGDGMGDDDEDEVQWEDVAAKLNEADNPYVFNCALLEVLQSAVEGHYKNLQKLLQMQPQSASSTDLVVEAVDLFNVLQDHLPTALVNGDGELAGLMVRLCQFVQEMVQGPCVSNQESLAKTNFLASCNRIFGCIEYPGDVVVKGGASASSASAGPNADEWRCSAHKCAIKRALLNLLLSLLEANPSDEIAMRCHEILDFGSIDRQIGRLCRVLGMAGGEPRYVPEGDEQLEGVDEELLELPSVLESELLLLCAYALKLHAVTPAREAPLPYLEELFNYEGEAEELEKLLDDVSPEQRLYAPALSAFLRRRLGYVEINIRGLIEPVYFMLTPEREGA